MEPDEETDERDPSRASLAGQAAMVSLGCAAIGVAVLLVTIATLVGGLAGAWHWFWAGLGQP